MSTFAHLLLFFLAITTTAAKNGNVSCPLDFNVLLKLHSGSKSQKMDLNTQCQTLKQALRLVESDYLQRTGNFLPPLASAESCWRAYQALVNRFSSNFDIRARCGFQTSWMSQGCMNINTRSQFEKLVPSSTLKDVLSNCNQRLGVSSHCAACTSSLSRLQASYLTGNSVGNLTDCLAYPSIYAAAAANQFGPTDEGTATCLFSLG